VLGKDLFFAALSRYHSAVTRVLAVLLFAGSSAAAAGGCAQACAGALLTGQLTEQGAELVVVPIPGGPSEHVVWPSGHAVKRDGDRLVLTNVFGQVVARANDRVHLGGGERESGTWVVCGEFAVETAPPRSSGATARAERDRRTLIRT
jgi:hypothetical protein